MNHVDRHLRSLPDELLADAVLRLRARVRALAFASTDGALRIRDSYQDALDAALEEQRRRDVP